ncbi:MAG: hypothetical protein AAF352_04445, partial [Pseudomonadota bacterium]
MVDTQTMEIILALAGHFTNIGAIISFIVPLLVVIGIFHGTKKRLKNFILSTKLIEANEQQIDRIIGQWRLLLFFIGLYVAIGSITSIPII